MNRRSFLPAIVGIGATVAGALFLRHKTHPRARSGPTVAPPALWGPRATGGPLRALWAVTVLCWAMLAEWPWNWALNPLSGVSSAVRKAIDRALEWVTSWVVDGLNAVYKWTTAGIRDLWDSLGRIAGTVGGLIEQVYAWARRAFDDVTRWAGRRIDDLANGVNGALRQLTDWARSAIDQAVDFARGIPRWVTDNVARPLWEAISDAAAFVNRNVLQPLLRLVSDLWSELRGAVRWLTDLVGEALDWVRRFGGQIWDIVQRAWDWLVWFATHTFDYFRGLLREAIETGPAWFVHSTQQAIAKEGSIMEEWIVRWLG